MTATRKIEIFSAGCPACEAAVTRINEIACESCEVTVLDMKSPEGTERGRSPGVRVVPAVVIDGRLADCCARRGVDGEVLRAAGLGQPLA